jgi:hypothetical protein
MKERKKERKKEIKEGRKEGRTTGVQTYSLHSHAIQFGKIYNSSYFLGNRRWIGMTSQHVFSDRG